MRAIFALIGLLGSCANANGSVLPSAEFVRDFTPAAGSDWSVCRSSIIPPESRLGAIATILGDDRLLRIGEPESCKVIIREVGFRGAALPRVELESCTVWFREDDRSVTHIEARPETARPADLQKCLFRIEAWVLRQDGALTLPDSELFLPLENTRWSGMGPMMPDVIIATVR